MEKGKLILEWFDDMVTYTTEKYFTNEIVENTLYKRKRILKENNGEKTRTHRETKSNFLTVLP